MNDSPKRRHALAILAQWVRDREENARRLADFARANDRLGWLQDAEMFKLAAEAITRLDEVEACAALSAEPAKWLPIDSAPRKGVWALVYAEGAMNCAFVERGKLPEDWCHAENPNVHPEYVTHWMPLPAGPGVSAVQQAAPDAAPMGQTK